MKIIAFYSIKGGVGKTTTAVNLAYIAAKEGKKVLLCDLDPQGASTFYLEAKAKKNYDVSLLVKGGKKLDKSVRSTDFDNLDILPSDFSFRNLDIVLDDEKKSTKVLKEAIKDIGKDYDYVFIDSPPNITLVSENIIKAANYIFVPFIPTTLSVLTYEKLIDFFSEKDINEKMIYSFFSMVDRRKKMHKSIIEEYNENNKRFLKTSIPYSSIIERMGETRKPIGVYTSKPQAIAYFELWEEMKNIISK